MERNPSALNELYSQIEGISVDYGLMEHAENILVLPAELGWDDVGNWESVWTIWQKDADQNAVSGVHVGRDTRNCVIFGGSKPVATVGLDNLIIVETDEALLICPRERAQEVRELVPLVPAKEEKGR